MENVKTISQNNSTIISGLEIIETYTVPLNNAFDWRVTLFRVLKDLSNDVLLEIIKKYEADYTSIEWNNDEDIFKFALKEGLLTKMAEMIEDNGKVQYDLWE